MVVCVPGTPERQHVGELPANADLVLLSRDGRPPPHPRHVELIIPAVWEERSLLDVIGGMHRLRLIQTLTGVGWLAGRMPEGVIVCNARGVYDCPVAEWVLGTILAIERGLIQACDAQQRATWRHLEPEELAS